MCSLFSKQQPQPSQSYGQYSYASLSLQQEKRGETQKSKYGAYVPRLRRKSKDFCSANQSPRAES